MSNVTETNSTTVAPDTTTVTDGALDNKTIGIIVAVLLAVLLLTAVILFILLRRRKAAKRHSTQQAGGSGVYESTTAPIDDETKVMLSGTEQHEMKEKDAADGGKSKSSPSKDKPAASADPNESSAALVNDDGNVAA